MTALVLALLFLQAGAERTGVLAGRVTSAADGGALPGAVVMLEGTQRGTTTAPDGSFVLPRVAPGTYPVAASLVGYARRRLAAAVITPGETTHVDLLLDPLPIQADPVVVTAARRAQSLQEVPVSVTTMDGDAMRARNAVTLDEALRYVPGVNMTEFQVNIRGSSGYSRGVGSRVLMLVDGIPLLTGDTEEINFESIPLGQVERVEVVKGASSALYGSSALGGVINVITRPIPEQPSVRASLSGGMTGAPSHTAWDWSDGVRFQDGQSATVSFRPGGAGALVHAARYADDGFRQNDFRRRYNLYGRLDLDLSTFDRASITANLLHQHRGSFLYWKGLGNALIPPDVQQGDRVTATRFFLTGMLTRTVSPDLLLSLRGLWFRNGWDDTIDSLTNTSRSSVLRTELQANWTPVEGHIVTGGAEGALEMVRADLFGRRSGGGFALYVQDEIALLTDLRLTLGVRYDWYDRDSLEPGGRVNPKAGMVWSPAAGTALRASVGSGFRVPSVAEAFVTTAAGGLEVIPNPALAPERSTSWEAGASQFLGGLGMLDAAVFQSDFWDLIEPRFVESGGVLKGQFANVTRARVRGVEAVLRTGLFAKALLVDVGYTYVRPWDLTLDDVLKYRPAHLVYVSASVTAGPVVMSGDVRHLSRVKRIDEEFRAFVNDADARVPITVVDASVRASFSAAGGRLTAGCTVKNILQYNYVELVGNLSPPRTIILTLEGSW